MFTPNKSRLRSLALIVLTWAILQLGGLFSPGLLDDVDSIYIQIAREMLQRHDFVTPTIDGIRFFDKPPLMYWLAAGSMRLFGPHFGIQDWAARLPLALGVLALLLAVYALGNYLFAPANTLGAPFMTRPLRHERDSQISTDRPGLYAALILATSLGPYLYTRFFIPDILIALWLTLSIHLFLLALNRLEQPRITTNLGAPSSPRPSRLKWPSFAAANDRSPSHPHPSALLPMLAFAAVLALNLLTKGLIGIVFPVAFVLLYLALTRRLKLLAKLHLIPSTLVFLAIAAPWHILAALRNPAIPMPPGLGLPARAGWAWFYLYNEHVARFLGRRIPHDYGQTPVWLFWLLALLWIAPWTAFLPAALASAFRTLRPQLSTSDNQVPQGFSPGPRPSDNQVPQGFSPGPRPSDNQVPQGFSPGPRPSDNQVPQGFSPGPRPSDNQVPQGFSLGSHSPAKKEGFASAGVSPRTQNPDLTLTLWAAIILLFFTLSSRQEYYSLPALPALALLVAGLLTQADNADPAALKSALACHRWLLLPLATLLAALTAYFAFTAPTPQPGVTVDALLTVNPDQYNLSLGHVFDLTGTAMGFFRGPLIAVALGMLTLGPLAYLIRRRGLTFPANLTIAAGMTLVLLATHEGLARFYPILGSKDLAQAIDRQLQPNDLILVDGELTSGSTLLFYTRNPPQTASNALEYTENAPKNHVLFVNGHVNGLWFGSFWPDAPNVTPTDTVLHHLWAGPNRCYFLTYDPTHRIPDLTPFAPVHTLATSGGKTILTNR